MPRTTLPDPVQEVTPSPAAELAYQRIMRDIRRWVGPSMVRIPAGVLERAIRKHLEEMEEAAKEYGREDAMETVNDWHIPERWGRP